jgi:hypothetical protein
MLGSFVAFLGIGRLFIFILQKFLADNVKHETINNLISCDLCLGTWIYTGLAAVLRITILSDVISYIPVLSEVMTGCFASFLVHLLVLGWKTKFDVVVI